jgi:hypothetical protein
MGFSLIEVSISASDDWQARASPAIGGAGTRRSYAQCTRAEPIDEHAHAQCSMKHHPLTGIRRYCTKQHGQKQCIKARGGQPQVTDLSMQLGPLPHKE